MTRRTAVITGGAGGLGRALTKALIDEGWFVAIIDLPGSEFQSAVEAVDAPNLLGAFACDLTDREQVAATCTRICDERPSVDLVIYNAGVTQISPFSDLARETHERVMNINYFGAVAVASHFLQPLRQSRGTHLAISSVAGFAPLVKRTAYAASKHAMEGFFGSLRAEEARHNVRVCIAAPSFIGTNINRPGPTTDGTERPGSATDGVDYMNAGDAARIILNGLRKNKTRILVGRVARLAWLISRLSPSLYAHLMVRNMREENTDPSGK